MHTLERERTILTPAEAAKNDFLATIQQNVGFLSFDPASAQLSKDYPALDLLREFTDEVNDRFAKSGLDAPVAIIGYGSLIGGGGRESVGDVPQDFVELRKWERKLCVLPNCWRNQQLAEGSGFSSTALTSSEERGVASVHYTGSDSSVIVAVMMPKTLRDVGAMTRKFDLRESPYVLVPVGMRNILHHGKELNVPALILHPVSEQVARHRFGQQQIEEMCMLPSDKITYIASPGHEVKPSITYTNQIIRGAAETRGREIDLAKTTLVRDDMTLEHWLETTAPGNNRKVRPWHGTGNESVDPLSKLKYFPTSPATADVTRQRLLNLLRR